MDITKFQKLQNFSCFVEAYHFFFVTASTWLYFNLKLTMCEEVWTASPPNWRWASHHSTKIALSCIPQQAQEVLSRRRTWPPWAMAAAALLLSVDTPNSRGLFWLVRLNQSLNFLKMLLKNCGTDLESSLDLFTGVISIMSSSFSSEYLK